MTAILLRRDFWLEWLCLIPLAAILAGGGLVFGGSVWWFRPFAIACVGLTIAGGLLRLGWRRDRLFLGSPLLLLGMMTSAWGLVQCVPLPSALVGKVAPLSERVYAQDLTPTSDGSLPVRTMSEPYVTSRIPISLDRAETVRRSIILILGLCAFWFMGRWTDRLVKLLVLAGIIIGLGAVHSALLTLQLLDGSTGLFGLFEPDKRYFIGPGWIDVQAVPHWTSLERVDGISDESELWTLHRPQALGLVGAMPGGLISYACLQTLALPMTFGCLCFLGQRRGSRFSFKERLQDRGIAALWCVMTGAAILASALIGASLPHFASLPIGLGLLIVLRYTIRADLEWWVPVLLSLMLSVSFLVGTKFLAGWAKIDEFGFEWVWSDWSTFEGFLDENFSVWRASGWTGIGLGAYSRIAPYVKNTHSTPTDAASTAIRMAIEFGPVVIILALVAVAWIARKSWIGFSHVDVEHRCLLGMILGTAAAFLLGFAILPGWDLPILTLIPLCILGVTDRVFCQATDLFMESWEET